MLLVCAIVVPFLLLQLFGKMIWEHVIVIGVAKGGNPPPNLFPCASKPTIEANEANEADVCVLTWPPEGEGCSSIIRTTKSSNLYPPSPRHLITKLKGSTESHFCIPRFLPARLASLLSEGNRGGGTAAARGRLSHPLQGAHVSSLHSL
jgi:hypothetical protein